MTTDLDDERNSFNFVNLVIWFNFILKALCIKLSDRNPSGLNSPTCLLFQLLYLCHMLKSFRGEVGETVQLLFQVFTVRFFYSNFVKIFVLISTKSNFILLRFYGGEMFYINGMKGRDVFEQTVDIY